MFITSFGEQNITYKCCSNFLIHLYDTRRKILLGSYLIKKMNANEANKEKILAELNEYLTEDRDRRLFDL